MMRSTVMVLRSSVVLTTLFVALSFPVRSAATADDPASPAVEDSTQAAASLTYIELDSWVYPAIERLTAEGVIAYPFLGLRPWTCRAISQMLAEVHRGRPASDALVQAIRSELARNSAPGTEDLRQDIVLDRLYIRNQFVAGTPLNDSYHFGQTLTNDFGRPYGHGWQPIAGFEARVEHGRFSLFVRGEFERSPMVPGDAPHVAQIIAVQDNIPIQVDNGRQSQSAFRLLDTYASVQLAGQQLSFGKQSFWWGPGSASAMMLSDNGEPFYSFRINRTLPISIPLLSRLLGPFRYDNFFGKLSGHMYPRQPYFYGQKISFSPTRNLELGFSRDAVIAGEGSTPLTFGNFWKSFTSTSSGTYPGATRNVNGARHASFDIRYRLPGVRNWLTVYTDSLAHDDISPVDAPRHAAITSGIYLSKFPFLPQLNLHVEGGSSDMTPRAKGGKYYYYEGIYRDCYLNKRNLMGSWLGREGTGGQAWATYSFNPQSTLQMGYRTLRVSQFFVPQGANQQAAYGELRYRWRDGLVLKLRMQAERWNAPALAATPQTNVTTQFELSFKPKKWKLPIRQPLSPENNDSGRIRLRPDGNG